MDNLVVSNALNEYDVELMCMYIKFGNNKKMFNEYEVYTAQETIDSAKEICFNGSFGEHEKDTLFALYNLSKRIDIVNPFSCYDFIKKIHLSVDRCKTLEEVVQVEEDVKYLQDILSAQFGDDWVNRLDRDKETFNEILEMNPDVSPLEKEELNILANNILDNYFDVLLSDNKVLKNKLKYQYDVIRYYIRYILK